MQRPAVRFMAAMLFAVGLSGANVARATEYGDLWWVPSESGWGMQTAQQANSMFITFYVFANNGQPTWFTALTTTTNGTTFTGSLYASQGSFYGSPYVAGPPARVVGTVTFTATSPTTANVTYTADGVTVTKSVQRFLLAYHNLNGTYFGSFLSVQHSCANPANNGPFNGSGQFTIVQNAANQVTITAILTDNLRSFTCTYQGQYSQLGRIGAITGTYTCTDGHAGTWNATEIEVSSLGGILARYSATNAGPACQITGGFGGLKPN
jgi:hypothetical protein